MGDIAQFFQANGEGWTEVAFETLSRSIPVSEDFGASVVGSKCGVHGQGTSSEQRHTKIVPEGTGVIGRGDVHGVYGIGSTVDSTDTPDFNSAEMILSPKVSPEPIGVVGVNGAENGDAPAIFGDNNIYSSDVATTSPNPQKAAVIKAAVTEGIQLAAGVEGMSYSGFGILGVSLNLSPDKKISDFPKRPGTTDPIGPDVHDTARGFIHDAIDPDAAGVLALTQPAGVLGLSVKGAGVRGVSQLDRGGIFQSAMGRYPDNKGDPHGTIDGPPVAQIRLVPHRVAVLPPIQTPPQEPPQTPLLPAFGQTGDLLAVVTPKNGQFREAEATLWFCVRGNNEGLGARWRLVNLTTMVPGADE